MSRFMKVMRGHSIYLTTPEGRRLRSRMESVDKGTRNPVS